MIGRKTLAALAAAALVGALALTPATSAAQTPPQHYTGTTSDGSQWIADVPSSWNGTLLLYSHGYGTLLPADAPDPTTQAQLLSMGYALAGSGYDPTSDSLHCHLLPQQVALFLCGCSRPGGDLSVS